MSTGHWYNDHWNEWHWHDDHWIRVPIQVVLPEDVLKKVKIQTVFQREVFVDDVQLTSGITTEVRQILDIGGVNLVNCEVETDLSFEFERPEVQVVVER